MHNKLEVVAYTIDNLVRLITEYSPNDQKVVLSRSHHAYFDGYFNHLKCRTIVVEKSYIDHDYLEDFSGYYVRCFRQYSRTCTRFHFFSVSFTEPEFVALLEHGQTPLKPEALQQGYLGFVVLKPLPATPIGRTCLRSYPHDGRRYYPINRRYEANLFGISLTVSTLAFQEQDTVVAACATSALWTVFHSTGILFQHAIPSPLEITRFATSTVPVETRVLPNNQGLTPAMMAHAIRHVGLEPFSVSVSHDDGTTLKAALYAYMRGGIPAILGILLVRSGPPVSVIGLHAIALTGYSLGSPGPTPHGPMGYLLTSTRIDKLYAHDDGVGPFARMAFDGVTVTVNGKNQTSLSTGWVQNGVPNGVRAVPLILLVPLYHKIRINYAEIHDVVQAFDLFVESLRKAVSLSYTERLEWDIYLTTANKLKAEIFDDRHATGAAVAEILTEGLPRYVWRATARINDRVIIDLLFDATDIQHGDYFLRAIVVDPEMQTLLHAAAALPAVEAQHRMKPEWRIIRWFR